MTGYRPVLIKCEHTEQQRSTVQVYPVLIPAELPSILFGTFKMGVSKFVGECRDTILTL